ncbi:hypothetical protein GCM10023158_27750 [Gluconacetobacter tumulicola]
MQKPHADLGRGPQGFRPQPLPAATHPAPATAVRPVVIGKGLAIIIQRSGPVGTGGEHRHRNRQGKDHFQGGCAHGQDLCMANGIMPKP